MVSRKNSYNSIRQRAWLILASALLSVSAQANVKCAVLLAFENIHLKATINKILDEDSLQNQIASAKTPEEKADIVFETVFTARKMSLKDPREIAVYDEALEKSKIFESRYSVEGRYKTAEGHVEVTVLPSLVRSLVHYRILVHELEHQLQAQKFANWRKGKPGASFSSNFISDAILRYVKEQGAMIMEWFVIRYASAQDRMELENSIAEQGTKLSERNRSYLIRTIQNSSLSLSEYIKEERAAGRNTLSLLLRLRFNNAFGLDYF